MASFGSFLGRLVKLSSTLKEISVLTCNIPKIITQDNSPPLPQRIQDKVYWFFGGRVWACACVCVCVQGQDLGWDT